MCCNFYYYNKCRRKKFVNLSEKMQKKLKLFNSLIEFLVVSGCDQDTGLKAVNEEANSSKVILLLMAEKDLFFQLFFTLTFSIKPKKSRICSPPISSPPFCQ